MLSEQRKDFLNKAIAAIYSRKFYAAYPEHPAPAIYGETADADGKAAFEAALNKPFTGLAQSSSQHGGDEVSPYTGESLGINYPLFTPAELVEKASALKRSWGKATADERANVLLHSLELFKDNFFPIAYATMHTTGQAYMMSFQASGPHAADRALEAVAMGYEELNRFPATTEWEKPMGKYSITLNKSWRAVPKGVAVVIGCSTFPTWNTVPGLYASLITGNPTIVKPHPMAVLPIAIVVECIQKALVANGFSADICQLGTDVAAKPITKQLIENEAVKLVDYTGGTTFGNYVESLAGKTTFTEKAGVNSIIIDSVDDLDAVLNNLAFSLSLYSGQMCTAPQNFFIKKEGIQTKDGLVSTAEFATRLANAVTALIDNPKAGPHIIGAIQNPATAARVQNAADLGAEIVLPTRELANPMFANARLAAPVIMKVSADKESLFSQELFGPIAFIIETNDTAHSVSLAKEMALTHGAISCGAYTTSADIKEMITDEMAEAYTPVSFNLTGGIYVNQNATFSDFHVTGGNPAGNASFTNPEYVIKRFTWVGFREPAAPKS